MSAGDVPRVVLDCVVFLQAVASPSGPAFRLLEMLEAGRYTLYLSDSILSEVRDVLRRPRVRAKNPAITDETTTELLDRLARLVTIFIDVPSLFSLPRDPDDEQYVNLALVAEADYLVTRDKDLLDLMNDPEFRARYPRLTVLNPVALLQVLTPQT